MTKLTTVSIDRHSYLLIEQNKGLNLLNILDNVILSLSLTLGTDYLTRAYLTALIEIIM